MLDFAGIGTALLTNVTTMLGDAEGVIAAVLGIGLVWRLYKRFLKA